MNRYIELNEDKSPKTDFNTFSINTLKLENAGLILDKNTVVVDFDKNEDIAEELLKGYPTKAVKTKRGYHLYFSVPKDIKITNNSNVTTVLGNKVDYKTGFDGKKAYAIVKLNGIDREVINAHLNVYPVLPKLLYPTKTHDDLIEVVEGNRNSAFFKHLSNVFDIFKNDSYLLSLALNINKFLKLPLPEEEVTNIVNSVINRSNDNQDNEVFTKGKLDLFKLSKLVENKLDCTIYNNILYFKINNQYTSNDVQLFNYIHNLGYNLKQSQDKEIKHQLYKTNNIISSSDINIKLKNGFSIVDGQIAVSDGHFSPLLLNVNYDPEAYDEHVDNFLNWFVQDDKELRILLEQILGHILMTHNFPQMSFFFVGSKGKNGKSTFFEMLSNFCGELSENLALEEMSKIEHLSILRDKLLNCGDDIDDTHILSSRTFKNLVSGNKIMVRDLYSSPKPFKNQATLLFSCNEMPKFKDKSGGIERRIRIIPCDNQVKVQDLSIDKKLSTDNAKSYLLNLGLNGIKSIISNGGQMIEPKKSFMCTQEYMKDNDSVRLYLDYRNNEINKPIDNCIINTIYMDYEAFCASEGVGSYSKAKLTRRLKDFGYKSIVVTINGFSSRIYKKIENIKENKQ